MSRRICLALDLIDDADIIAGYEAAHAPGAVWPQVIAGIRQAGYQSMEIWRTGDRLFMVAEVADDWPRDLEPNNAEVDADWQYKMDSFQKRLPHVDPSEKWAPMTRIFSLDEQ